MKDKMSYVQTADAWVCSWCANAIREYNMQTALPTDREQEADEIAPDMIRKDSTFFFKSIRPDESDYEDSINTTLSEDEHKYTGSAQSALEQDNSRFAKERERIRHQRYMQTTGYYSHIIGNDSTEVELDRHRARRIKEVNDNNR